MKIWPRLFHGPGPVGPYTSASAYSYKMLPGTKFSSMGIGAESLKQCYAHDLFESQVTEQQGSKIL